MTTYDQPTIAAVLAVLDRLITEATHEDETKTKNLYNIDLGALAALRRARARVEDFREGDNAHLS